MAPRTLASALVALLTACSANPIAVMDKLSSPAERAFARGYLQLLADSQLDSASGFIPPEMLSDTARTALIAVGQLLRTARLDSVHVIGVNVSNVRAGQRRWRDLNLSFEMPTTSSTWVVANVATHTSNGQVRVIGVSATPFNAPLEVLNRFTFKGRSFRQYLALLLLALAPVPAIWLCIGVARAKGMPWRWLWAVAALVGSPVFMLNWTTGEFAVRNTIFLFFGASAVRAGPAAPWILSFAAPLGAFAAYMRLRAWRHRAPTPGVGAA